MRDLNANVAVYLTAQAVEALNKWSDMIILSLILGSVLIFKKLLEASGK